MVVSCTSIAGVGLSSFVMNASGPKCAALDELKAIASSGSAAVMMKSCTVEPRVGNPEPRFAWLPNGSIQGMGLPNLGYLEYVRFSSLLKGFGKPVVASVSGFSVEEYALMVSAFQESDVNLIEVNLSCPNIEGKPQVAYDFAQTEKVLNAVCGLGAKPVGLKLPPYFDPVHHRSMAEIISRFGIRFISCINSIGNALAINPDSGAAVIRPRRGFGGLSGPCIKYVALANVRSFYDLLGGKVQIFGVGGIESGLDAFEFLLAGADAVQVASAFEREGLSVFGRIDSELKSVLEEKGYSSVSDARGQLRFL